MRPNHRRSSARFLSLVVATSLTSSARLAKADPDPPSGGALAAVNQSLGDDIPASRPRLAKGSKGTSVKDVQVLLNADRKAHGSSAIDEDGDFGSDTYTALRSFQKEHNLEQTGVVDEETWDVLAELASGKQPTQVGATGGGAVPGGSSSASSSSSSSSASDPSIGAAQRIATLSSGGSGTATDAKPATPAPASGVVTHAPMKLSAASLEVLARIIEAEAGVCSEQGKIAVGAVVLNRVRAGYANGTVLGVVAEEGQFDGYNDSSYRGKPSADSVAAAKAAAAGQDPSNGAYYYYNPYLVAPAWARTMKQTARIGTNAMNTHRFMKP